MALTFIKNDLNLSLFIIIALISRKEKTTIKF
jgi:hypothetical protein